MNNTLSKPGRPGDETSRPLEGASRTLETATAPAEGNVEGEIREFVRRDVAGARRLPHVDSTEFGTGNVNFLIERVAGTSIKELDNLIAELQAVRDYLQAEGERVQREVSSYAQVSQAAMSSAKIILDSMGQWKSTVGTAGGARSDRS
jgi:hypothetical protein